MREVLLQSDPLGALPVEFGHRANGRPQGIALLRSELLWIFRAEDIQEFAFGHHAVPPTSLLSKQRLTACLARNTSNFTAPSLRLNRSAMSRMDRSSW